MELRYSDGALELRLLLQTVSGLLRHGMCQPPAKVALCLDGAGVGLLLCGRRLHLHITDFLTRDYGQEPTWVTTLQIVDAGLDAALAELLLRSWPLESYLTKRPPTLCVQRPKSWLVLVFAGR